MSLGGSLLIVLLLGVAGVVGAQHLLERRSRSLEGSAIPPLPPAHAALGEASTLLWFHSPRCGPCRAMKPHVWELVDEGTATVVDVTQDAELARVFGVMATPTTIRIAGGQVRAVRTGVLSGKALRAML